MIPMDFDLEVVKMEKLIKIAEITATNEKRLNDVLEILKNNGLQIIYNEEYDYSAYICVTEY